MGTKSALALKLTGSQIDTKPVLSRSEAARLKRKLIQQYCEEKLSAEALATVFALFEELKSA